MTAYIIRRLLTFPILLTAVAAVTLALGLYGPGDPARQYLGKHNDPEAVARLRDEWGLDKPFYEQLGKYVIDAVHGDFHTSLVIFPGRSVSDLIGERLVTTLQINGLALALGLLIGIPLGITAAVKHNQAFDQVVSFSVVAAFAIPTFAIAPILQWIFARELPLRSAAMLGVKIGLPSGGWDGIFSLSAVLPMVVLCPSFIAMFARQTRIGMIGALGEDYVRTARAKGLRENVVIVGHAFRNALIPLVTIFGIMLAGVIAGAVIVESLFGIPGVGLLMVTALNQRDYPVVLAITLMAAFAYITLNLVVDISYRFIDPRIRYQ